MGDTVSTPKDDAIVQNESGGFHIFELHLPSASMGIGLVIMVFVITFLAIGVYSFFKWRAQARRQQLREAYPMSRVRHQERPGLPSPYDVHGPTAYHRTSPIYYVAPQPLSYHPSDSLRQPIQMPLRPRNQTFNFDNDRFETLTHDYSQVSGPSGPSGPRSSARPETPPVPSDTLPRPVKSFPPSEV